MKRSPRPIPFVTLVLKMRRQVLKWWGVIRRHNEDHEFSIVDGCTKEENQLIFNRFVRLVYYFFLILLKKKNDAPRGLRKAGISEAAAKSVG